MTISERDRKTIGRLVRKYGAEAIVALAQTPQDATPPGRPPQYPTNRAMIWAHVVFRCTGSGGRKRTITRACEFLEADLKRLTVHDEQLNAKRLRSMYYDAKKVFLDDAAMKEFAERNLAGLHNDAAQASGEGYEVIQVPLLQAEEGNGIVSTVMRASPDWSGKIEMSFVKRD